MKTPAEYQYWGFNFVRPVYALQFYIDGEMQRIENAIFAICTPLGMRSYIIGNN